MYAVGVPIARRGSVICIRFSVTHASFAASRDGIMPLKDLNERRKYMKTQVLSYYRRTKQKAIEYKGGKCVVCGYSKCHRALGFHHLNSSDKRFNISSSTRSFASIKKELDKCILVCANCHAEIHEGLHRFSSTGRAPSF